MHDGSCSRNARQVIVALHGLGRRSSDWDPVRVGLERLGHVLTPDLPRSAADALEIARRVTPEGAVIIGHSFGGVLAMQLTAEKRLAVRRLILTNSFLPPARDGRSHPSAVLGYLRHRVELVRQLRSEGRLRGSGGARDLEGLGRMAQLVLRRSILRETIEQISSPTLIVHSLDDHHVPADFARAGAADHPSWDLSMFESGGHYLHRDVPEAWLNVVEAWIGAEA